MRYLPGFLLSPLPGLLPGYGRIVPVIAITAGESMVSAFRVITLLFVSGAALFAIPAWLVWPPAYLAFRRRWGLARCSCLGSAMASAVGLALAATMLGGDTEGQPFPACDECMAYFLTQLLMLLIAALPAGRVLWRLFLRGAGVESGFA